MTYLFSSLFFPPPSLHWQRNDVVSPPSPERRSFFQYLAASPLPPSPPSPRRLHDPMVWAPLVFLFPSQGKLSSIRLRACGQPSFLFFLPTMSGQPTARNALLFYRADRRCQHNRHVLSPLFPLVIAPTSSNRAFHPDVSFFFLRNPQTPSDALHCGDDFPLLF